MSADARSEALHQRVLSFALGALSPDVLPSESFEGLARDILRYQLESDSAVARLARQTRYRGSSLSDLPAVPADAFRRGRVAVHDRERDVARFHTSGTTGGSGVHAFRTLETYRELTVAFGRHGLLAHLPASARVTVLALARPFEPARRSSLGFMMHEFMQRFDGRDLESDLDVGFDPNEPGRWLVTESGVDTGGLRAGVAAARRRSEPVLLLATSFALVWLLEALGDERLPLPPGSVVMQTGGFKGHSRTLDPAELAERALKIFAIAPERLIGEYGMTELSSQLYDTGLGRGPGGETVFVPPPWLRVEAVDAVSLAPLPAGEVGLGRFIDLANVDSALCVLTQDRVRCVPNGVVLMGRKPRTRSRGCSLAIEELSTQKHRARPGHEQQPASGVDSNRGPLAAQPLARVQRLIDATRRATRPGSPERRDLCSELSKTSGLSTVGIERALDTCLELEPSRAELDALVASVFPSDRAHVILPANVFVASHRALALALASAPRVFVKPSRRQSALVRAVWALAPDLFELVSELPVRAGDNVWAYGSDTTLDELRGQLPAGATLHAYGDGFGVALVELSPGGTGCAETLLDREWADAIAKDTCWFDQRGCLSPRLILARGSAARVQAFTAQLVDALVRREAVMPRGRLDADEQADAAWYQACAACAGVVLEAGQGSVAVPEATPLGVESYLDVPPLGRHLEVIRVAEFDAPLAGLASWLTSVGVSDPKLEISVRRVAPKARVALLGAMQTPPFDGPVDLRSEKHGERL